MLVGIYRKTTKECLGTADIDFGLDVFFIDDCRGISKSELDSFLSKRVELPCTYEIDEIVLKKLGLYKRRNEFGRMTEAKVLYAMLNYFESEDDDYCIHPIKNEIISMIGQDFRYSNIYVWRKLA